MRNKGWQLCSPSWKRKRTKRKKSYYNTGYSYLVTHPSTNLDGERGLFLMSGRNMLLSLWYSESTLNAFFEIRKTRKDIKEKKISETA